MNIKSIVVIIAAALSFGVAGVAPAADGWGQCSITNLKACAIGTIVRDHRNGTTQTFRVCRGYYGIHKLCRVK